MKGNDNIVRSLGIVYLDEFSKRLEHDANWLQKFKSELRPKSNNISNKVNAAIRVLQSDIQFLIDTIMKEESE